MKENKTTPKKVTFGLLALVAYFMAAGVGLVTVINLFQGPAASGGYFNWSLDTVVDALFVAGCWKIGAICWKRT